MATLGEFKSKQAFEPRNRRDGVITAADMGFVNPKNYGVKADGVTNDRPTYQQLLDNIEAAGGGNVMNPAGVYLMGSTLLIPSNTTIAGAGENTVFTKSAGVFRVMNNKNAGIGGDSNITLRDFVIDGARAGVGFDGSSRGLFLDRVTDSVVERVKVKSCQDDGFVFQYCKDITISSSVATDNTKVGFYVTGSDRLSFIGCRAIDQVNALSTGFGIAASWYNTFNGCSGRGNPSGDFGLSRDSRHNTLSGGVFRNLVTVAESIGSAVDGLPELLPFHADHIGAPAGGYLDGVTYSASYNIFSGVKFIGAPGTAVLLVSGTGGGVGNRFIGCQISDCGSYGIFMNGNHDTVIQGCDIWNTGNIPGAHEAIIAVGAASRVTVQGNTIFDTRAGGAKTTHGIGFPDAASADCVVAENTIRYVALNPLVLVPAGIVNRGNVVI
jgi:hypothetical protein